MEFEQKFIQIPLSSQYWDNSNLNVIIPAQWLYSGVIPSSALPPRTLAKGVDWVQWEGLQSGAMQWRFYVNDWQESQPLYADGSRQFPSEVAYGLFANYSKLGEDGAELIYSDGIQIGRVNQRHFYVRLLNEDSLFPGYLNVLIMNPVPHTKADHP